jgi:hypothetical protein
MRRSERPPVLALIQRLNSARASGDCALALVLEDELDRLDRRYGYSRTRGFLRTDDQRVGPVKKSGTG